MGFPVDKIWWWVFLAVLFSQQLRKPPIVLFPIGAIAWSVGCHGKGLLDNLPGFIQRGKFARCHRLYRHISEGCGLHRSDYDRQLRGISSELIE